MIHPKFYLVICIKKEPEYSSVPHTYLIRKVEGFSFAYIGSHHHVIPPISQRNFHRDFFSCVAQYFTEHGSQSPPPNQATMIRQFWQSIPRNTLRESFRNFIIFDFFILGSSNHKGFSIQFDHSYAFLSHQLVNCHIKQTMQRVLRQHGRLHGQSHVVH